MPSLIDWQELRDQVRQMIMKDDDTRPPRPVRATYIGAATEAVPLLVTSGGETPSIVQDQIG
jgi:hypothetical protein